MEILRIPPYPIVATWTLPTANYSYKVSVEDLVDHSVEESTLVSNAQGVVTYSIPLAKLEYDRKFFIKFYDTARVRVIYEENLDIIKLSQKLPNYFTMVTSLLQLFFLPAIETKYIWTQKA
jgi:hypothetical protein